MIQKIEKFGSIRAPKMANSANTDRINALTNIGKQVNEIAFNTGAKLRTAEGKAAGEAAGNEAAATGAKPEQQSGIFPTFFDESFDNAQQGAYLATSDIAAIEKLNQFKSENPFDIETYNAKAEGYKKGKLENMPQEYRQPFLQQMDKYISNDGMNINAATVKKQRAETESDLLNSLDIYSDQISQLERNGASDEDITIAQAKATKVANLLVSNGSWTKEQASQSLMANNKEIFRQGNKRDILQTGETNYLKAVETLKKLEGTVPGGYNSDEWEGVINDIRADLNRLAPDSARSKARGNTLLKDANAVIKSGQRLTEKHINELVNNLSGTDKAGDLKRVLEMDYYSSRSSKERNDLRVKMGSPKDLSGQKDLIAMQLADDNITKLYEADGMGAAIRSGRIVPAPITGGDMTARNEQASELSEFAGVQVGPFAESEIQDFIASMGDMTIDEKADFAMSMGDNPKTFEQFDNEGAGQFAILGAKGNKSLAKVVLRGEERINLGQYKLPSKFGELGYLTELNDLLGNGEIYGPGDTMALSKAIMNHYAATAEEGDIDKDELERSYMAVTGGKTEVNGRLVEKPEGVPSVSNLRNGYADLEDVWNEMQPETLASFGGGLKFNHSLDKIHDGQLISVGSNRYQLDIDGMRQPNAMDGTAWEIEITPELVLQDDNFREAANKKNKAEAEIKRAAKLEAIRVERLQPSEPVLNVPTDRRGRPE